ncbi:MAG: CBS domain-containing protein [Ancrocorticia sp.]|uniref:CBS domain-containing protein n=1 Tax=Ancrocorticia sp. TaxID=2593684 RepID=UPI003F9282C5
MRVSQVIKNKGTGAVTAPPTASILDATRLLADHRIGAIIVMDGEKLAGIISERDIVRFVRESGDPQVPVSRIMTSAVTTCSPDDDIADLAIVMTNRKIRHLPVVNDGKLAGIVSIGDIVKGRLDELETERNQLEDYIRG